MIEPEVPTAVVVDDRSALDVGATAVAVPVCRDAIAYATATLGSGRRHAALYTPSDPLAAALTAAGVAAGERLWRMPLVDDYRETLESAVADVAHVETRKMGGGSITAALFLQRFAGEVPWAHLDIAGPGRADADEHEVVKGGTAFGTRALLYWLETDRPVDLATRQLSRATGASRRR